MGNLLCISSKNLDANQKTSAQRKKRYQTNPGANGYRKRLQLSSDTTASEMPSSLPSVPTAYKKQSRGVSHHDWNVNKFSRITSTSSEDYDWHCIEKSTEGRYGRGTLDTKLIRRCSSESNDN